MRGTLKTLSPKRVDASGFLSFNPRCGMIGRGIVPLKIESVNYTIDIGEILNERGEAK